MKITFTTILLLSRLFATSSQLRDTAGSRALDKPMVELLDRVKEPDQADLPSPIPTISLAPFTYHERFTDDDRSRVVQELLSAARDVGFFLLKNHSVDAGLVERAHRASNRFFDDTPLATKQSLGPTTRHNETEGLLWRGYAGSESGGRFNGRPAVQEPVEKFTVKAENNMWPQDEDFQLVVTEYYDAIRQLANQLVHLLEDALRIPQGTVRDIMGEEIGQGYLRLLRYHKQLKEQEVMGGHTDLTTVTIVSTDQPGYELVVDEDRWQPIPHVSKDVFVVNLGDTFRLLTNGSIRSSVHRVRSPGKERNCLIYFADVGVEYLQEVPGEEPVIVDTLPQYLGEGRRFDPIDFKPLFRQRINRLLPQDETIPAVAS